MVNNLKIAFAGTPIFAQKYLATLLEKDLNVVAVYTQPDRPSGRGRKLKKSPVKEFAESYNVVVYQPNTWKDEKTLNDFKCLKVDIFVVVAYGLILPQCVLDIPTFGCINVHASLLPRWRGAAPIPRAIEAGDIESGITIMQMDSDLDTGDILLQARCPILPQDTSENLHDRLVKLGQPELVKILHAVKQGTLAPIKQENMHACYAEKISRESCFLDWEKPAKILDCQIRAFIPWPVCYFKVNEQVIKVWAAESLNEKHKELPGTIISVGNVGMDVVCREGVLRIMRVQMAGGREIMIKDLLNSRKTLLSVGDKLA